MTQTAQNISVRYKVNSVLGTRSTGGSGFELPIIPSDGMRPAKAAIESPEVRSDGMTTLGRHGSRSATGSYGTVLRVGAPNDLLGSLLRTTVTAAATITNATMTSITTTTNTIVAAAGSWITQGVRAGDLVYLTNHSTAGNNNIILPVISVSASTITVPASSLTLNASPDSSFELNVLARYSQPATPAAKAYYTIEEYHQDIDQSEVFDDCMVASAAFDLPVDGTATIQWGFVGRNFTAETTGTSPILTAPTGFTNQNLVATDAVILLEGAAIANLTGLQFTCDNAAALAPVIGSTTSPDVYPDNLRITGTLSGLRADLTMLTRFIAETEFAIAIRLQETTGTPAKAFGIYLPAVKLMESPSAPLGGSGPMVSSMSFVAGRNATATGELETMVQFSTSPT